MVPLILYVVALVLFAVAAFGVALPRVSFGWLGAAFFTAAVLFGGLGLH
jgi:hypothetical protein